ncbi:MAG: alkanesulfonate monooxygenase SsuD [Gammaproteobacteria bacterium]|jgi:alkanesulfonate monooxygenase SsuD/methylene tetrahydromethanopterin reductase-like flavin-dependent oxidoreductase (luciferase family)
MGSRRRVKVEILRETSLFPLGKGHDDRRVLRLTSNPAHWRYETSRDVRVNLGLLLPNQGVVFGATTVSELLELAEQAESSGAFESPWVGDNLLAKPRLESVTLLSALAARTKHCRLGTACMASFPLRHPVVLAAQWGALDCLAEGRTVLTACIGGGSAKGNIAGAFNSEYAAMQIDPRERTARMEEGIDVLRILWTEDPASFEGRFYRFEDIAVRPQPATCPSIWIANNPWVFGDIESGPNRKQVERVARLADGWMTVGATPKQFATAWQAIVTAAGEHGRDATRLENSMYFNLNINDDREVAYTESKRFLDEY